MVKKAFTPQKSVQAIIAEIHNEFDTASEKLLNEAKEILAGSYDIEKGERLKKVGFTSARKVAEAEEVILQLNDSKELARLVDYYQLHYPNNKFITEGMVKQICQKYGLICGETKYYISDVPEKNLAEIEKFELRRDDLKKRDCFYYRRNTMNHIGFEHCSKTDKDAMYGVLKFNASMRIFIFESHPESVEYAYEDKEPFFICASVKDFDTNRMRITDGYKLEMNLPDPIVLQPVKGGYLIVTKWGLEAEDESLVNEKLN
jgi:hypothetical protein